ncbi:MAG: A/G-specific adenine glycosylase, partial [Caulobacterales bacterium]
MVNKSKRAFRAALLSWYVDNARALPWRAPPAPLKPKQNNNYARQLPYKVWLSEVMLQQTTVAAVAPRFNAFLERWPNITDLAAASFEDVAQEWAGLGYYARARNLHACAKVVSAQLEGEFPQSEAALLELPGIGDYTAAAVAAIAFDVPANVVDGNVERVMARLFAVPAPLREAKVELKRLAGLLVADDRAGDYAQALMDLGATICTPRSPKCLICPVAKFCAAFEQGLTESIPAQPVKAKRPVRYGAAYALVEKNRLMLERRPPKGLLGGMLGLPCTDWTENKLKEEDIRSAAPSKGDWSPMGEVRHVFTHFELRLQVWRAQGRIP